VLLARLPTPLKRLILYYRHMSRLAIFGLICGFALLAAWLVNALVGILSGEHPKDTGRVWSDIIMRIFATMEFGLIGRILGYLATAGWPLRVLYGLGTVGILRFFIRGCHASH
jgi:hypothetical protein